MDLFEVESVDGNENEYYSLFLGFDKVLFCVWRGVLIGFGGNRDEGVGMFFCIGVGWLSYWIRV